FHDLEAAIGPAVPLLLVGLEAVRQQSMAVTMIGVMGLPAELEQSEPKIRVFADCVTRPAAGRLDRLASNQAHRAVHDDRALLVALDQADIKESGVFAVHRVVHDAALAIAVILRRL